MPQKKTKINNLEELTARLESGKVSGRTKKKNFTLQEVKVPVKVSNYLNHYISPHLVDLKSFFSASNLPEKLEITYSEPVEDYFEAAKISLRPNEEDNSNDAGELEVAEVDLSPDEVISQEMIGPVEESIVVLAPMAGSLWRRILVTPVRATRWVLWVADQGANRVIQPLRRLPFTPQNKALLAFIVMAVVLVLPISGLTYYKTLQDKKNTILSQTEAAVGDLKEAEFLAAQESFNTAKEELDSINALVAGIIHLIPDTDKTLTSGQALIKIGENLSLVGNSLEEALGFLTDDSQSLAAKVEKLKFSLDYSLPLVEEINQEIIKVDISLIPQDKRQTFQTALEKMPQIAQSFKYFSDVTGLVVDILGQNELKRYLLVFQNNNEIRPAGGFIGSFALLDLVDGQIKNLEIPGGGSYDLRAGLKENFISPEPLQLVRARWEFQDSNWFSDWPTAASKIIWFYNQSGGPTVDGVIALNADLMENLLKIVGSVEMAGYSRDIDSDNFFVETQKIVELEYDRAENKPKQFIADLAPEMLDKIFKANRQQLVGILSLLNQSLTNKDLQLYFTNPDTQAEVKDLGWSNEIEKTDGDYLLVVNANIGGQKTDAVIEQSIMHQADVNADGSIINTVTVIRKHLGHSGDLFTGGRNVNYLRLYVPAGSQLISASGFDSPAKDLFKPVLDSYQPDDDLQRLSGLAVTNQEQQVSINQEFGKTVFGGWTQTDPGTASVITFKYRLPFKIDFATYKTNIDWLDKLENKLGWAPTTAQYSLLVQKQSGVFSGFYSLVNYPNDWREVWHYPGDLQITGNEIKYGHYLDQDRIYSLMFIK
ncbi:MAG: DUF4012 domain-containing protein [Patescibacteria group bacterium]